MVVSAGNPALDTMKKNASKVDDWPNYSPGHETLHDHFSTAQRLLTYTGTIHSSSTSLRKGISQKSMQICRVQVLRRDVSATGLIARHGIVA